MGRYIKKFTRIGSIGPTEERGFGVWVGYDIAGVEDDLSEHGLIRVDGWSEQELAERNIVTFASIDLETLGIERNK